MNPGRTTTTKRVGYAKRTQLMQSLDSMERQIKKIRQQVTNIMSGAGAMPITASHARRTSARRTQRTTTQKRRRKTSTTGTRATRSAAHG